MEKVVQIRVLPNWTLEVRFDDGTAGEVCLKDDLYGEVFEPLKYPAFFAQAFIDEDGAICWPNGADLAPDALYEDLRARTKAAGPRARRARAGRRTARQLARNPG